AATIHRSISASASLNPYREVFLAERAHRQSTTIPIARTTRAVSNEPEPPSGLKPKIRSMKSMLSPP
ncbi:MAG TPA: hypothetical protein VKB68_10330, partial [Stellaceae bacterium]|nr:hypothetical protein [Stellaceae bacterium]